MGETSAIQLRGKPKNGRHPNFRTGLTKHSAGYVLVFVGRNHHLADCRGYAYQHRLNAEIKIGRQLLPTEFVHHVDEDKSNNHPDNLRVYPTRAHHFVEHRKYKGSNKKLPDELNMEIDCGCGCGGKFMKYDTSNRPRKFIQGHNMVSHG